MPAKKKTTRKPRIDGRTSYYRNLATTLKDVLSDHQGQMLFRLRELAKVESPADAYGILAAVNNLAINLEREISSRKHLQAVAMESYMRAHSATGEQPK